MIMQAEAVNLLRDYQAAREDYKAIRGELVRFTVERLGLEQEAALKGDPESFIQGYLIGLRDAA